MNVSVPLDTILYIESIDRKTFFYDKRRVFEGKETLSSLENKLDNSLFVRISKSCIVNIAFIASSYPMDNHRIGLVLKDGERLVVGRTYAEKLESRLSAFNLNLENETVEKDFAAETTDNSIISSILNNNKILHFHERPQRVVAVTYTCAELLCALGLEDRIIGIASISNDLDSVLPKYREKLKDIPISRGFETLLTFLSTSQDLKLRFCSLSHHQWKLVLLYAGFLFPCASSSHGKRRRWKSL